MNFPSINVKKFMFDVNFDLPGVNEVTINHNLKSETNSKHEKITPNNDVKAETVKQEEAVLMPSTFTQEELDEATQTSFALGEAAGIKKNSQTIVALQTNACEQIVENLKILSVEMQKNHEKILQNCLLVATTAIKKIFPHIAEKHGLAEITVLLKKYLPLITNQEKITIKVNPKQKPEIDSKISELTKQANFEGSVNVIEETAVLAGDCQVIWDNGGVDKNTQKIIDELDKIIQNMINKPTAHNNEEKPK